MAKQLLISIITPSYNQGKFIEDTILAVKNQNYSNLEHIIIDGGSVDGAVDTIKKYEETYNMHWISEKDKGPADAINKGFSMARGDIFAWINSDDFYEPRVLKEIVETFKNNPDVDFVLGNWYEIRNKNVKILCRPLRNNHLNFLSLIHEGDFIGQPATFFTARLFKKAGPLDINLKYAFDYDLWLRMFRLKIKYIYINKSLANFRCHTSSISIANREESVKEAYRVAKKYFPEKKFLPQIIKFHRTKYSNFFDKLQKDSPWLYNSIKNIIYWFLNKLS